jgi:hypothetical protein
MNRYFATLIAGTALFGYLDLSQAGTLTITSGPNFNPPGDFANTTIVATSDGSVIHAMGDSDVTAAPGGSASISISGNFSLAAGETFSYAYQFTIDLTSTVPVTMTVGGSAMITSPITFNPSPIMDTQNLQQGTHMYTGNGSVSNPFPFAISGTFQGSVTFDFAASASASAIEPQGAANTLHLTIPTNGLLFGAQSQPVQVPEPSTYALLALAFAGVGVCTLRRRANA